jgi:hypothetical protein
MSQTELEQSNPNTAVERVRNGLAIGAVVLGALAIDAGGHDTSNALFVLSGASLTGAGMISAELVVRRWFGRDKDVER